MGPAVNDAVNGLMIDHGMDERTGEELIVPNE